MTSTSLFALQFALPETHGWFTWLYLALSVAYLAFGPRARRSDFLRLATSWPGRAERAA